MYCFGLFATYKVVLQIVEKETGNDVATECRWSNKSVWIVKKKVKRIYPSVVLSIYFSSYRSIYHQSIIICRYLSFFLSFICCSIILSIILSVILLSILSKPSIS